MWTHHADRPLEGRVRLDLISLQGAIIGTIRSMQTRRRSRPFYNPPIIDSTLIDSTESCICCKHICKVTSSTKSVQFE